MYSLGNPRPTSLLWNTSSGPRLYGVDARPLLGGTAPPPGTGVASITLSGLGSRSKTRLHIDATYHREADYASTVWRPAVEVSLRLGRYAISAARGGGANYVGGTFRVGLELDLSR